MRLLLDTRNWIWSLTDPKRLAPQVAKALSDPKVELWLSAISVCELLVLIRKHRLYVTGSDGWTWVSEALRRAPLREAPVTHAVAMQRERLLLDHWDPADRFIAGTARVLDATLVTADERLIEAADLKVLANR